MDRHLLDLLACPTTRQPLRPIEAGRLEALNRAIAEGRVRRGDGSAQSAPVDAFMANITAHCGKAYEGRIVANEPKPTTPDRR